MQLNQELLWRNLFETCKILKKVAPWEFWVEEDIIVIEDPITKQKGYCVIEEDLGEQQSSITILVGEEGLKAHLECLNYSFNLFDDMEDPNFMNALLNKNGFKLEFVNRDELFKEDYEQIKELGMSFRGKWPLLRRLYPGSRPWLLEEDEDLRLFNVYLSRLLEICIAIEKQKIKYVEGCYLTSSVENGQWVMSTVEQDELLSEDELIIYQNDLKAHRVKKLSKLPKALEVHQFYLPQPMWDDELNREIFPLMTTMVDHESGLVYLAQAGRAEEKNDQQFADCLADILLTEYEGRPSEIILANDQLLDVISDFCEKAEIECNLGPIPATEEFMDSFMNATSEGTDGEDEEFFRLMEVVDHSYEVILSTDLSIALSDVEKEALKYIWMYSVLFMYKECDELPGEWTKDSFESLLQAEVLEFSVKKQYKGYINKLVKSYLSVSQQIDLFKRPLDATYLLNRYYN